MSLTCDMNLHTHTHTHTHIHTHANSHGHMLIQTLTHTRMLVHVQLHTCAHWCKQINVCVCRDARTCSWGSEINADTEAGSPVNGPHRTASTGLPVMSNGGRCVCVRVCVCACI